LIPTKGRIRKNNKNNMIFDEEEELEEELEEDIEEEEE